MAKFYGKVGYATRVETAPGVWQDEIVELPRYGDVLQSRVKIEPSEHLNDEMVLNNQISIVHDIASNTMISSIRYVVFSGGRWKVTSVDAKYPRIILTLGGVYNGPTPSPPQ